MKSLLCTIALFVMAQPALASDSFWKHRVRGWDIDERNKSIIVDVGRKEYRVTTRRCFGLNNFAVIGFDSFGSKVRRGDSINIYDRWDYYRINRCRITDIEKL